MADDRRLKVLSAIVSDYVRTREPVGSKAIVERYQLGVSPATIRHDMSALEAEGYIHQPHTSAGRVPTEKGYRLFVDEVARMKPLSAPERAAITALLTGEVDLDQVVARSVRVLAQLTGQLAVVEYPSLRLTALRHVELVVLGPARLLMVIITDTGRVEQRTVAVPGELSNPLLVEELRGRLNTALVGKRAQDVLPVLASLAEQAPVAERALVSAVTAALIEALRPEAEERIAVAGTANLAKATPDFRSLEPLLDAVEEQVVLLRLFSEIAPGPDHLSVRIGSENDEDSLAEASVVTASYSGGGDLVAHLGVVGPTRMDYGATMSTVRAVAGYLSHFLSDSYEGGAPTGP